MYFMNNTVFRGLKICGRTLATGVLLVSGVYFDVKSINGFHVSCLCKTQKLLAHYLIRW